MWPVSFRFGGLLENNLVAVIVNTIDLIFIQLERAAIRQVVMLVQRIDIRGIGFALVPAIH